MAYRAIGLAIPAYSTARLNELVLQYGPTGTIQPNGLWPGVLVRDSTTGQLKTYDGTTFIVGMDLTPAPDTGLAQIPFGIVFGDDALLLNNDYLVLQ